MTEVGNDDFPLITIITPTYNSNPRYMFEAIDSVLMQTYPKIEYIISDDGSADFPKKTICEYLEERKRENINYKIIRNEINLGIVKNVNRALRVSNGKYIFMLAHDDVYYDRHVIEEWVSEFLRTGALVITALRECWDINNQEVINTLPTLEERGYLKELSPYEIHTILMDHNFISGASTAYSMCCIKKYNLFDERYHLLEDYPTYLHITYQGTGIQFWERLVIKYRLGGVTTNKMGNLLLDIDSCVLKEDEIKKLTGIWKIVKYIVYLLLLLRVFILKTNIKTITYDVESENAIVKIQFTLFSIYCKLRHILCHNKRLFRG